MATCSSCGASVGADGSCPSCRAEAMGSGVATQAPNQPSAPRPHFPTGGIAAGTLLVGRYRIVEKLGQGGMGEVYRAEDLELRETVALKMLPAALASDTERRERLRQEVSLARRVSHPSVCRVHDVGQADGRIFLSMEYIDGEDLATLLARIGRLASEKALAIAREVTAGLAAAHAAGVLHRDLKPANVMLDRRGRARLTDFGLAVVGHRAGRGELAGTPLYMAPEQLAGEAVDETTDIYALGLLLYELITGSPAYAGRTLDDLRRAREAPPALPSSSVRDLDPRIEDVIMRCLAHDRAARPASALAVLTALSGGDPLQAAIAAGQTPSPSAVADAPARGAMRPVWVWVCAGIIAAAMVLYLTHARHLSVVEGMRMELPPEALAVRARQVLMELGYPGPWRGEAWGFAYDRDAIRYLGSHGGWGELAKARPAAIFFWYRAAESPIVAPFRPGRITESSPPLEPGMVTLRLDPRGRLLRLTARPADSPAAPGVPPTAVWALAGLEGAGLAPAEPRRPPVFADTVSAWQAQDEEGLRLEAASLDGRVVYAALGGPWSRDPAVPSAVVGFAPMDLLGTVALLISLFLAWKNIKAGRGDTRGALRLGATVFGLLLSARMLTSDFSTSLISAALVDAALERALYYAAFTSILYLALEPHVRRVWPQRLVSWTRLLEGRWRDPMVARDVLIGAALACGSAGAWILATIPTSRMLPVNPIAYGLSPLLGTRYIVAALLYAAIDAATVGLLCLVLLLALRLLPGPPWLGSGVLALALSAATYGMIRSAGDRSLAVLVVLAVFTGVSWVLVLTRVGVLAMMAGMFVELFSSNMPNVMSLSGWTSACAWAAPVVVGAIVLYGVRFAAGPRGPWGLVRLEDRLQRPGSR